MVNEFETKAPQPSSATNGRDVGGEAGSQGGEVGDDSSGPKSILAMDHPSHPSLNQISSENAPLVDNICDNPLVKNPKSAGDIPLISKSELIPMKNDVEGGGQVKDRKSESGSNRDSSASDARKSLDEVQLRSGNDPTGGSFDQPPPLPHKKNKSGSGLGGIDFRRSNGSNCQQDISVTPGEIKEGEEESKKPLVDDRKRSSSVDVEANEEKGSKAVKKSNSGFWSRFCSSRTSSKGSEETDIETIESPDDSQSGGNGAGKKKSSEIELLNDEEAGPGKELTPVDEDSPTPTSYYNVIFAFTIFALLMFFFAFVFTYMYPEIFDLRYLHMIAKHGYPKPKVKPIVATNCGLVEGMFQEKTAIFRGIPYADPPVGSLRWKEAQEPPCEGDYQRAVHLKSFCYQKGFENFNISLSEDCLYLNIYSPNWKKHDDIARPVLVYIPGDSVSGYQMEDISWMPSEIHVAKLYDVIFVTLNYRTGVFGFVDPREKRYHNYALSDLRLALKYVHDNIHLFGGDSDSVTVIGHGAGGTLATILATDEIASKFIANAWLSNPDLKVSPQVPDNDTNLEIEEFLDSLGCQEAANGSNVESCLLNATSDQVLNGMKFKHNQKEDVFSFISKFKYAPLITVESDPVVKLSKSKVQVVIGMNAQETGPDLLTDGKDGELNIEKMSELVRQSLTMFQNNLTKESLDFYLNMYNISGGSIDIKHLFHTMMTDMMIICPTLERVTSYGKGTNVYVYVNEYKPSIGLRMNPKSGSHSRQSVHGMDILAIFDLLTQSYYIKDPSPVDEIYLKTLQGNFRRFMTENVSNLVPTNAEYNLNMISANGTLEAKKYPFPSCAQIWS